MPVLPLEADEHAFAEYVLVGSFDLKLAVDGIGPDPGAVDDTTAPGQARPPRDLIGQRQPPQPVPGMEFGTGERAVIESDTLPGILPGDPTQHKAAVGIIQHRFLI